MIPAEALCAAAISGDLDSIDSILEQDASLVHRFGSVRDDHRTFMATQGAEGGWTALHLAAYYGQPEVIHHLMTKGANINACSGNALANTPLHAAVAGRQGACVEALLDHGPDRSLKDPNGMTALDLARAGSAKEIVALLDKGEN